MSAPKTLTDTEILALLMKVRVGIVPDTEARWSPTQTITYSTRVRLLQELAATYGVSEKQFEDSSINQAHLG